MKTTKISQIFNLDNSVEKTKFNKKSLLIIFSALNRLSNDVTQIPLR